MKVKILKKVIDKALSLMYNNLCVSQYGATIELVEMRVRIEEKYSRGRRGARREGSNPSFSVSLLQESVDRFWKV